MKQTLTRLAQPGVFGGSSAERRSASGEAAVAIAFVAALTAVRIAVLLVSPLALHGDEAQYWVWSLTPDFGYFTKPPLIAWTIAGSTAIFGDSAWAIRLISPVLHGITALVVFAVAARLWDSRTGLMAAVVWSLVPAVSYSSLLATTDVPLLLFWAVMLLLWHRQCENPTVLNAVLLGLAIGAGLNAKYAMVYAVLCMAVHAIVDARARSALLDPRILVTAFVAIALIAPNIWWNASHGWATLDHTADNAQWSGVPFHPGEALEFFSAQFGVFGPVALALVLWRVVRALRGHPVDPAERFLLTFSIPVILLITIQALLSRANANWAAVAYVAAALLVARLLTTSLQARGWRLATLGLHALVAVLLYAAVPFAADLNRTLGGTTAARLLGWEELGTAVASTATDAGLDRVVTRDRMLTASLFHVLRNEDGLEVRAVAAEGPPSHHFELAWPHDPARPALLVERGTAPSGLGERFGGFEELGQATRPGRKGEPVVYRLYRLGPRGPVVK